MKLLISIAFVLMTMFVLYGQTSYLITAGGGGSSGITPYFDPQFITIDVGDTVIWNNIQGTHNVDGSAAVYPSNPEFFSSGAGVDAPWEFTHVFSIPGFYNYECSMWNHNLTQFGTITVIDPQSVEYISNEELISVYPNPFTESATFEIKNPAQDEMTLHIMDVTGNVVRTYLAGFARKEIIERKKLSSGIYFLVANSNAREFYRKKVVIQ